MTLALDTSLPQSRSRRPVPPGWLRRMIVPVAIVVAWQAASSTGFIGSRMVPSPLRIVATFTDLTVSGELGRNLLVSLGRVALGLGIGVGTGAALALIAGLSRLGEDSVDATVQMVRTLPHLALVPLFILWFGIGETPKVALVALGSAFPIYLNLFAGIRGVDPKIVEAARTFGLSRTELVRHIVLPGALPAFLTGLRYALGLAWLSLVVGEQINADSGLGALITNARDFLQTDVIVLCLLRYAVLGLSTDAAVRLIEARVLHWRVVVRA